MRNSKWFGRLSVVFLSLALSAPARGSVNMWSGALIQSWTDLSSPSNSLQLRRTYHSRSLVTGIFGFGWCTEFDIRLQSQSDGSWRLRDCDSGEELRFTSPPAEIRLRGGSVYRFSKNGQLSRIVRSSAEVVTLVYTKDGRLSEAVSSAGEVLKFTYDFHSARVIRVDSSQNTKALYQYKNKELSSTTSDHLGKVNYEYDSLNMQNLTLVEYGNHFSGTRSFESVTYDPLHDRVSHRSTRDGCTERYSYSTSTEGVTNRLTSEARKTCGGETVAISRHEYTHTKKEDGRIYLTEARVTPLLRGPSSVQLVPVTPELRYASSRETKENVLTKKLVGSPVSAESRQR